MPADLDQIALDTDLEGAAALLDRPRAEPQFALPESRFLTHRAAKLADQRQRRGIRSLIRPANAAALLPHLPSDPSDRTHCLLRGDFVLCDLIPALVAELGWCPHLRVATLGLSLANADTLALLVETGRVARFTLVVSHYFQQIDKTGVFPAVVARLASLGPAAVIKVTRSHAKVICLPFETLRGTGDTFVIEGSANLRSSDNLEEMLITNDPETHAFHAAWIDQLAAAP